MKLTKNRISLAIGAVLGASTLAPAISYGVSFDVLDGQVAGGDAGDSLLFPFYTTTGSDGSDAVTSFSVTNTANATVAVKIRFREQKVGYDALDFIAVLSPYDKFDFWVAPGGNGRPIVEWDDNTCVVGPDPDKKSVEFPDPAAYIIPGSGVTNDDLAAGNLEVLGIAALGANSCVNPTTGEPITVNAGQTCAAAGGTTLKDAATHSNSSHQPANCQAVREFFSDPQKVKMANADTSNANSIYNAAIAAGKTPQEAVATTGYTPFLEDAPNSLIGRYLVTIPGRGIEGGEKAISIQNSNLTSAGDGVLSPNPIHVTAQSEANCAEQAQAGDVTQFGNCKNALYAWDVQEYAHPHLGDMTNLANLQSLLNTATTVGAGQKAIGLSGDWSTNPENHVTVNWIASFPNKYANLDLLTRAACTGGTGTDKVWCLLDVLPTSPQGRSYLKAAATCSETDTNANCVVAPPVEEPVIPPITVTVTPPVIDPTDPTTTTQTGTITLTGNDGQPVAVEGAGEVTITTTTVNNVPVVTATVTVPDDSGNLVEVPATVITTTVNGVTTTSVTIDISPVFPSDDVTANMNFVSAPAASIDANFAVAPDAAPIPTTGTVAIQRVEDKGGLGVVVQKDPVTGNPVVKDTGKCAGPNGNLVGCNAQHPVKVYAPVVITENPILSKLNAWKHQDGKDAAIGTKAAAGNMDLCTASTMQIRGPEEQTSTSYTVSPGGSSQIQLCNEVNVVSFTKADVAEPSLIQTDAYRKIVTVRVDAERGWAFLPMGNAADDSVVGLNFTTRDTDSAQNNNGTITELNKVLLLP